MNNFAQHTPQNIPATKEGSKKWIWIVVVIGIIFICFCVIVLGTVGIFMINPNDSNSTEILWEDQPTEAIIQEETPTSTPEIPAEAIEEPVIKKTSEPEIIPDGSVIDSFVSDIDGAVLVYVPAGEFEMGSNDYPNEQPVHTVYLDEYWLYQTEVTNKMYRDCVENGICNEPQNLEFYENEGFHNHPVMYVTWSDASTYCYWAGADLPTEAQWEKAARGTDGRIFPWGDTMQSVFVNYQNWIGMSTEIGSFPEGASPYGVYDMAGNAWEWVLDWYDSDFYSDTPLENPVGPIQDGTNSLDYRVLRGGSWSNEVELVRTTYRDGWHPDQGTSTIGFRCMYQP